jgi:hypothetical protein
MEEKRKEKKRKEVVEERRERKKGKFMFFTLGKEGRKRVGGGTFVMK